MNSSKPSNATSTDSETPEPLSQEFIKRCPPARNAASEEADRRGLENLRKAAEAAAKRQQK